MAAGSSPLFFQALDAGALAIALQAVADLPPAASTRLADSPFRIEIDISASTPIAAVTIAGDAEPICTVPSALWPRGFGAAIAAFVEATVGRLAPPERRAAIGLMAHARTVVVLEPTELYRTSWSSVRPIMSQSWERWGRTTEDGRIDAGPSTSWPPLSRR